MKFKIKVSKVLTPNDTGETRSHQSGISIDKTIGSSGVFPKMSKDTLNPRTTIDFYDENGVKWSFPYIYYNDKFHGKPTKKGHNELRITRVKDYIRSNGIVSGDEIWFAVDENAVRHIGFNKKSDDSAADLDDDIIHIKGGWKIINI